jgi:hypothetical protein
MDARLSILKARIFPLKERLSLKDIDNALQRLADIGCVRLYECDSKPYLYLPTWEAHQRVRNKRSKYPDPEKCKPIEIDGDSRTIDSNPLTNSAVIQSVSVSESESESVGTERGLHAAQTAEITLTLNDKSEYSVTLKQVQEWKELYPAVDIRQELRKMKGWLDANPSRRKTKAGILRFITGWLAKEQDKGGKRSNGKPQNLENSSLDLDEYEKAVQDFVPVFGKKDET